MEPIELAPHYTTRDLPGRCLKCLAEEKLFNCMSQLLKGEGDSAELQEKFETLVSFLKSPESQKLRDESEKYLAEGKDVSIQISFDDGKPKYELKIHN